MTELQWSHLARNDLLSIVDYISDDNPEAAQHLKDDVEEKVLYLLKFPKMGKAGRVKGTRELVTWANYIVVYQVKGSVIMILRILHAAQQWPKKS